MSLIKLICYKRGKKNEAPGVDVGDNKTLILIDRGRFCHKS